MKLSCDRQVALQSGGPYRGCPGGNTTSAAPHAYLISPARSPRLFQNRNFRAPTRLLFCLLFARQAGDGRKVVVMLDMLETSLPAVPSAHLGSARPLDAAEQALLKLGQALQENDYRFTTITPASHHRVNARDVVEGSSPEDIFGWSRPFRRSDTLRGLIECLAEAGELELAGSLLRSGVRFSTLGDQLFIHSAFPTQPTDAVFFGPDTYRFARIVRQSVETLKPRTRLRILDVGAGSGAGGLHAAALLRDVPPTLVLTDINRRALRCCRINAALNGVGGVRIVESDLFAAVDGVFDLIISNPPYLVDPLAALTGTEAVPWVRVVAEDHRAGNRPARTGRASSPLYRFGGCGRQGHVRELLCTRLAARDVRFDYEEIDPDVFGEESEHPPYDRVDRIAAVGVSRSMFLNSMFLTRDCTMSGARVEWTRWAGGAGRLPLRCVSVGAYKIQCTAFPARSSGRSVRGRIRVRNRRGE